LLARSPMRSKTADPSLRDDPLAFLGENDRVASLLEAIERGGLIGAQGGSGSFAVMLARTIHQATGRLTTLVVAHLDEADESVDELVSAGTPAMRLPAVEALPGETAVSLDLFAERLGVMRQVLDGSWSGVLVCPIHALMQRLPGAERLDALTMTLSEGDERGQGAIVRWLDAAGYKRLDAIEEPGDFAVRGGIIDVFPAGGGEGGAPVRLDFFGDELESLREIDLDTMGSDRRIESIELVGADLEAMQSDEEGVAPTEILPSDAVAILHETMEVVEQGRGYFERASGGAGVIGPPAVMKSLQERFHAFLEVNQYSPPRAKSQTIVDLPVESAPSLPEQASEAVERLGELAEEADVCVFCQNEGERQRLTELLQEHAPNAEVRTIVRYLHRGFLFGGEGERRRLLLPHHELFHRFQTRRRIRRLRVGRAMDTFLELSPGDYVVHQDHGVAKFTGLKSMRKKTRDGEQSEEFLTLEFAERAKLHVPAAQIDKVQKYIGGFKGRPPLSTLGGKRWKRQKEQVEEAVRDLAAEMLRIHAAREHMPGVRYPGDTAWQREFEAEFPYEETEDQIAALGEIKRDMSSPRPMDRLICGDVGYGKTELAIRAAFKAAEYGRQVAVLVPTTVLAEQHEQTFKARFAEYPFTVASLSRFKSRQEQREILKKVERGQIDIIIGTHRLLSEDVRFNDLGLVVVDEEQRFGVEHKQKLLSLRMTADVLTLSATPIPRTLHMSLLGLRDISSLSTPPMDRRAIVTEVIPWNERRINQAIARELNRGGQVFFVHNRVHNIHTVADEVQKLAPDARIVVGHGQMAGKELEQVMLKFIRREADILVCTTIIESGIDIPTANTMFVADADRFGLAELHQLRGRVGRHKHRAYCYLLLPLTRTAYEAAKRRLRSLEEFSMLGAGFKIAMRDLEIRGAGNLLGAEQSGHIAAVGYEMYCRLLEKAVSDLKHESRPQPAETTLELGAAGALPKAYIPSDARRMEAYRRISGARSVAEVDRVERDLASAYGEPPTAAKRLLEMARIRIGAQRVGAASIRVQDADVIFNVEETGPVMEALRGVEGSVRPVHAPKKDRPPQVYFRPPGAFLEPDTLLTVLRRRLCGEGAEEGGDGRTDASGARRRIER